MDNMNLEKPMTEPKEPNKIKLFWQNLSRKQKIGFMVGGIIIVVLLVIGFVVSMNMAEESGTGGFGANGESSTTRTSGGDENNEGDAEDNDALSGGGSNEDNYVDATTTPIEGGDPNNIDTYLPHTVMTEPVYDEETQETIQEAAWSIEINKSTKEILLFMHNLDDQETKDTMYAYLNSIPAELTEGYSIEEVEF